MFLLFRFYGLDRKHQAACVFYWQKVEGRGLWSIAGWDWRMGPAIDQSWWSSSAHLNLKLTATFIHVRHPTWTSVRWSPWYCYLLYWCMFDLHLFPVSVVVCTRLKVVKAAGEAHGRFFLTNTTFTQVYCTGNQQPSRETDACSFECYVMINIYIFKYIYINSQMYCICDQ